MDRFWDSDDSDEELAAVMEDYEREQGLRDEDEDEELAAVMEDYERRCFGYFRCECVGYVNRESQKIGVRERHYRMQLDQIGGGRWNGKLNDEMTDAIYKFMKDLIIENGIPAGDRVYFGISSNRLCNSLEYRGLPAGEWIQGGGRVNDMLDRIAMTLNSNENFKLDDSFQLSFTHARPPPGGLGQKRKLKLGYSEPKEFLSRKGSVIKIVNDDNLCAARAIITAKAKIDSHCDWENIRQGRKIQESMAKELHREAGIMLDVESCGYAELTRFADTPSLTGKYRIVLVDVSRCHVVTAFGKGEKDIAIVYSEGHYDVVTSLAGFFGTSYFCKLCLKGYNTRGKHACGKNPLHCHACQQDECHEFATRDVLVKPSIHCEECNRYFYGSGCLQNHLSRSQDGRKVGEPAKKKARCSRSTPALTVCMTRKKCQDCKRLLVGLMPISKHKCGYGNCPSCQQYVDVVEHRCYIQKVPAKKKAEEEDERLLVFFDIEARQDGEECRHIANLLVAEREDKEEPAVFEGEDCVKEFLRWLDRIADMKGGEVTAAIAHNLQGYDGYFIIDEYHRQHRVVKQIRNGAKPIQIRMNHTRFIDSLSFFQMPLSEFPNTFGLEELKKGFFPHLFNTVENQDYVGSIPDEEYFMSESMSVSKHAEFKKWYSMQVGEYNFAEELEEYCRSDVKLLKEGCLTFKQLFETVTGFNPFEHITIASACNRDLRQNRMIENSIGSEPILGWRRKTNQSRAALEWLNWKAKESGQSIQHVGNSGEYIIPGSRHGVDGYCQESNTIYEFQGCFWHGCRKCYKNRTEKHRKLDYRTMAEVYECTVSKVQMLKDRGYKVEEMWECEWSGMKAEKEWVRNFVESLKLVAPLEPRDAFYGGRTNAIKLYHSADLAAGERILYYDFTSLYPFINKRGRYPVGHPTIVSNPEHTDMSQYFGLAKVTILAPRNLYHPVLPVRMEGKLTFPLCGECARSEMSKSLLERSDDCHHDQEERKFTGTWCTPEIEKAVQKGYSILYIHEVWHFEDSKVGLFEDYVNTYLKLKEESSGWASTVRTEEEKERYLQEYENAEGIELDYEKMEYNPGMRSLAKVMLNSMWGKFGQQSNKMQVKEIDDPKEFWELHESDKVIIKYVGVIDEERVEVHHVSNDKDDVPSPNLNIFVAAFTTCLARLHLYETLDKLGDRVLYMDTDSVIFTARPGQYVAPLGSYLGEFKDECARKDRREDYIVEFVTGGAKNYGYRTKLGKIDCKVRGFTLNKKGLEQLNFGIMKENVLQEIESPLEDNAKRLTKVVKPFHIVRQLKNYSIKTDEQIKNYRLVYDKRVLDPNTYQTYPYGYRSRQ